MSVEAEFAGIRGIENTTAEFRTKLAALAGRIGARPRDLASVMAFETGGTFSPSVVNKAGSKATGLIQFMPKTARALGTSVKALAGMTAIEQLYYVEKYFAPYRRRGLSTEHDLYMAVLYPMAIGKGESYGLFTRGTKAYRQNGGLDRDRDGVVTAGEAVRSMLSTSHGRASVGQSAKGGRDREQVHRIEVPGRHASIGQGARGNRDREQVHRIEVPGLHASAREQVHRIEIPDRRDGPDEDVSALAGAGELGLAGAIVGLLAVAAEHYRATDPELAGRYESMASLLAPMAGEPAGRQIVADRGLSPDSAG
ncbi:MAG: hypothetical protein IT175_12125 [Acidobacteria bacterium]|nr:hypothetical protein [Acidobacteriota bacterium]